MSELAWQKSTFSEPGSDTCIEVAVDPHRTLHLRESDTPTAMIATTPAALRALLHGIKAGATGTGPAARGRGV